MNLLDSVIAKCAREVPEWSDELASKVRVWLSETSDWSWSTVKRVVAENKFVDLGPARFVRYVGNHIYFVQESGAGFIKIGISSRVVERVYSILRSGPPHRLTVLAVIKGDRAMESGFHRRFSHAHILGEWFRPTPDLLNFITTLRNPT